MNVEWATKSELEHIARVGARCEGCLERLAVCRTVCWNNAVQWCEYCIELAQLKKSLRRGTLPSKDRYNSSKLSHWRWEDVQRLLRRPGRVIATVGREARFDRLCRIATATNGYRRFLVHRRVCPHLTPRALWGPADVWDNLATYRSRPAITAHKRNDGARKRQLRKLSPCRLCGEAVKKLTTSGAPPRFCSEQCRDEAAAVDAHATYHHQYVSDIRRLIYEHAEK